MKLDAQEFKPKGMQKDMTESSFSGEFAFDNMNMSIIARDSNTLMALSTEQGNKIMPISDSLGVAFTINGIPLGYSIIGDTLILFTHDSSTNPMVDYIYQINSTSTGLVAKILYSGNLNFDGHSPIETLSFYENVNIQKVYWLDNRNQPRVINIASNKLSSFDNNSFDFIQVLSLNETISITKNISGTGIFPAGIVQYAFAYYNKYGQESNVFYTTPIYYSSPSNRGGNADEAINNTFTISASNLDTRFDYIRIYSIIRTSINATPTVKQVVDLSTKTSISFTDTNTTGVTVDPTLISFIGGEKLIVETFAQKDNTLFLGNIKLTRPTVGDLSISGNKISDLLSGGTINLQPKLLFTEDGNATSYPYKLDSLNTVSDNYRTLKARETYRFGLQFQHITGKWSEPIWVNDKFINLSATNSLDMTTSKVSVNGVSATYTLSNTAEIITTLLANDYVKTRGVIVYPTLSDRSVIAQGVLNPTLYNVEDKAGDASLNVSSWYFRPSLNKVPEDSATLDSINESGAWNEFKHGNILPDNSKRNCEIQCITDTDLSTSIINTTTPDVTYNYIAPGELTGGNRTLNYYNSIDELIGQAQLVSGTNQYGDMMPIPTDPPIPQRIVIYASFLTEFTFNTTDLNIYDNGSILVTKMWDENIRDVTITNGTLNKNDFKERYAENFIVDQSIVTMHSPEIEFDDSVLNMNGANLKLRIIGLTTFTGWDSSINVLQSTANKYPNQTVGFYPRPIKRLNYDANYGAYSLISRPLFNDATGTGDGDTSNTCLYVVYPWQRDVLTYSKSTDSVKYGVLSSKTMSNLRYSGYNLVDGIDIEMDITPINIFNSNENVTIKIEGSQYNTSYQGNVDKVVIPVSIAANGSLPAKIGYNPKRVFEFDSTNQPLGNGYINLDGDDPQTSLDPVRIQTKSTPHAVFELKWGTKNIGGTPIGAGYFGGTNYPNQKILPSINSQNCIPDNSINQPYWCNDIIITSQDNINTPILNTQNSGGLWLAELYRDVDPTILFGGQTQEAFEANEWLPCGEPVSLIGQTSVNINYTEGDTFVQRYDCLKTYGDINNTQSLVEILSFLCETHINLDAKTDRNRGLVDNRLMSPLNFNLRNTVYDQINNFNIYRALNYDMFNINNFPNTITWTLAKIAGDIIDKWTNVTLANTIDMDGVNGPVRALRSVGDEIIVFQDSTISGIQYNSRVQVNPSDGIPIEISNSGKVEGKNTIALSVGVRNKWSIALAPKGLYFVDTMSKGLFYYGRVEGSPYKYSAMENLTDSKGLSSWALNNLNDSDSWNPIDFNNFVTQYDDINDMVYFINNSLCLGYSIKLKEFMSFYSYESTPFMFNIFNTFISLRKPYDPLDGSDQSLHIWEQNKGDFSNYFGTKKPFWTTVIANKEPEFNKIFNTISFKASVNINGCTTSEPPFDRMDINNDYQYGTVDLNEWFDTPSSLKKTLNTWRVTIPRDSQSRLSLTRPTSVNKRFGVDRISSNWAYIKLIGSGQLGYQTILNNLIVNYSI